MLYPAYVKIAFEVRWAIDGRELDARLLPLLRAIAAHGSLNQAVRELTLSYRHAWGMLGELETALGEPLVRLERGRGARLTALGERFLATQDALAARVAPLLDEQAEATARALTGLRAPGGSRVTVSASHDLALGRLRDALAGSRACRLDLHFQGSLDCLAALSAGRCDFAGFHVPDLPGRNLLLAQYLPHLKGRSLRVIHFVTRQQGLMVAAGNPLGLGRLADLARMRARFVNRQLGSGTRLAFDHLLAAGGIAATQITGYEVEEFTHVAVAATIASGMADAGFGIEAAARQHGLGFVPLMTERYFLAAREATLKRPGPRALLAAVEGAAFRKILRDLPGYSAAASMTPQVPPAALAAANPVKSGA